MGGTWRHSEAAGGRVELESRTSFLGVLTTKIFSKIHLNITTTTIEEHYIIRTYEVYIYIFENANANKTKNPPRVCCLCTHLTLNNSDPSTTRSLTLYTIHPCRSTHQQHQQQWFPELQKAHDHLSVKTGSFVYSRK